MKRPTSRKPRPGWTRVTVDIPIAHLQIAKAIAAAMAETIPEEPCTWWETVSFAAYEGMIQNEKVWLGTCSLDHSVRPWETEGDYPKTTLPMLALVEGGFRQGSAADRVAVHGAVPAGGLGGQPSGPFAFPWLTRP